MKEKERKEGRGMWRREGGRKERIEGREEGRGEGRQEGGREGGRKPRKEVSE